MEKRKIVPQKLKSEACNAYNSSTFAKSHVNAKKEESFWQNFYMLHHRLSFFLYLTFLSSPSQLDVWSWSEAEHSKSSNDLVTLKLISLITHQHISSPCRNLSHMAAKSFFKKRFQSFNETKRFPCCGKFQVYILSENTEMDSHSNIHAA